MNIDNAASPVMKQEKRRNNMKTALESGALSAGLTYLFFPKQVKYSMRSYLGGKDAFVKKNVECGKKAAKSKGKIFFEDIATRNAKLVYPTHRVAGKNALGVLLKTFAMVSCGVYIGNIVAEKIFNHNTESKAESDKKLSEKIS